jgi:hypothetical protein
MTRAHAADSGPWFEWMNAKRKNRAARNGNPSSCRSSDS